MAFPDFQPLLGLGSADSADSAPDKKALGDIDAKFVKNLARSSRGRPREPSVAGCCDHPLKNCCGLDMFVVIEGKSSCHQ